MGVDVFEKLFCRSTFILTHHTSEVLRYRAFKETLADERIGFLLTFMVSFMVLHHSPALMVISCSFQSCISHFLGCFCLSVTHMSTFITWIIALFTDAPYQVVVLLFEEWSLPVKCHSQSFDNCGDVLFGYILCIVEVHAFVICFYFFVDRIITFVLQRVT